MIDLIRIQELRKDYPVRGGFLRRSQRSVHAVDGVSLSIREGECLAIVGESGSGKSTLARCVVSLIEATAGSVMFDGEELSGWTRADLRHRRRFFQMIFQDPVGSLNPRQRVAEIVAEPLEVHRLVPAARVQGRVRELLQMVGVSTGVEGAYPHQLSGGQRQRVAIARALATEPRFLVADEPVSALDVSLRGQIINLLAELRERLQLTVLLIAHDLVLVEQIADRVAVMYAGKIVELASTRDLYRDPQHPYTASLLSAVPNIEPRSRGDRIVLSGEPPDPAAVPRGCRFHPRCPAVQDRCRREEPELIDVDPDRQVACFYPGPLGQPTAAGSEDGTF